jgi:hypothetical protein
LEGQPPVKFYIYVLLYLVFLIVCLSWYSATYFSSPDLSSLPLVTTIGVFLLGLPVIVSGVLFFVGSSPEIYFTLRSLLLRQKRLSFTEALESESLGTLASADIIGQTDKYNICRTVYSEVSYYAPNNTRVREMSINVRRKSTGVVIDHYSLQNNNHR